MLIDHPEICLFQPEIPQNTGNIGRLAAATNSRLHLIRPFGFGTSDKNLRRSGLDYWPFLDLEIHDTLEPLLTRFGSNLAFFSKYGTKPHWDIPEGPMLLVFGRETSGLPDNIHKEYSENLYQIPMYNSGVRSLNLANAVSVVVYDRLQKKYRKDHE